MNDKQPYRIFLLLVGGVMLLASIGFVVSMQRRTTQNMVQEQPTASLNDIYVRIPWRSGAIDLDPHWQTTFTELGLEDLASLQRLPTAPPTLDPWENSLHSVSGILLTSGDLSGVWFISVGHGFIQILIDKTFFLYYDTIGLEEKLLRQGVAHGWLTDIQRLFPEHDFTDLKPTQTTGS